MKKFGVGIQLYGLRNTMAEDFEGTLKAVADLGYEYVEFAGYYGHTAEEIKAILDKYGLKCISAHQALDFYDEDPDAAAEFLKAFGVKYSIIPWYGKEKLAGTDEWAASAERFKKVGAVLKAHGMKLGYHNHDFEFEKHEGKYLHDYIFDEVGDLIDPELDTCWAHYAGINPADKIREFAGRVEIVHTGGTAAATFMNVLYVTDKGNTNYASIEEITNAQGLEGGVFDGKIAGLFATARGGASGTLSCTTAGSGSLLMICVHSLMQ